MMKIPDKIKIAGREYTIEYSKNLYAEEHAHAIVTYNVQKIVLNQDSIKQAQEEAFIHEICHAIVNVFDQEQNTEKFITPLAELLYQAIQQIV